MNSKKTRSINHQALIASALALSVSVGAGLVVAQTDSAAQPQPAQPQAAQPQTVQPQAAQAPATMPDQAAVQEYLSYRDAAHAAKALESATRRAYQLDYAAQQAQGTQPRTPFLQVARTLLNEAQTGYAAGEYFASEKKAKAASELFKAAESVYRAAGITATAADSETAAPLPVAGAPATDLGPLGEGPKKGGPKGNGPKDHPGAAVDAPFRAAEELQRLTQELAYYRLGDARVTRLQGIAENLLAQSQTAQQDLFSGNTGAPAGTTAMFGATNRAASYASAASDVAKAARNLIEAARGF